MEKIVFKTRDEIGAAAAELAAKRVERTGLETDQAAEITAIKARFSSRVKSLGDRIEQLETGIRDWCAKNEGTVFAESSVLEFPEASVQWKKSSAFAVSFLESWTEKKVIEWLQKWKRIGIKYIRIKMELDRAQLGRDRETHTPAEWAKRGIEFVQGRSLTVEGKAAVAAA